jgi:hypothetical protein
MLVVFTLGIWSRIGLYDGLNINILCSLLNTLTDATSAIDFIFMLFNNLFFCLVELVCQIQNLTVRVHLTTSLLPVEVGF